jgi:hypothetical protein
MCIKRTFAFNIWIMNLDAENSTYAGLAQENGFAPAFLLTLV